MKCEKLWRKEINKNTKEELMNIDELILNNTSLVYFMIKKMGLFEQKDYYQDIGMLRISKGS